MRCVLTAAAVDTYGFKEGLHTVLVEEATCTNTVKLLPGSEAPQASAEDARRSKGLRGRLSTEAGTVAAPGAGSVGFLD